MMPHPECPHRDDLSQCRISSTHAVQQPEINWVPVYDGSGAMTNFDPNTHVSTYSCQTCGRVWEIQTRGAESTLRDKTSSPLPA